ncbi:MAG: hypothetical protein KA419_01895 [Acidobacteria bacterium]|nr:hypothetical protein [Acidobacteriota bacterium]
MRRLSFPLRILAVGCAVLAGGARFAPAQSGRVLFHRIGTDEGLSQNSVTAMCQDRQGFLWFGTYDGLNRYDGYAFTVFRHDPRNPGSLSNNWVNGLCLDREGRLWIATEGGGLNVFDPRTATFRRLRHRPGDPASIGDDTVHCVRPDPRGDLWVGTPRGLDRVSPRGEVLAHFTHRPDDPGSLSDPSVHTILVDGSGGLWAGTLNGLNRLRPGDGRFDRFYPEAGAGKGRGSPNFIAALHPDRKGFLWVGTGQGLFTLDPRTGVFRPPPRRLGALVAGGGVSSFCEADADSLVIGTNTVGIVFHRPSDGSAFTASNAPEERGSLSFNVVMSLLLDQSGMLWVGTMNGVNALSNKQKNFHYIGRGSGSAESLSAGFVMAVHQDPSGALWIGSLTAGLDRYDPRTGRFTHYRHDPARPDSLGMDGIWSILMDRKGRLWVGTYGRGLDGLDPATGRFSHFRVDPRAGPETPGDVIRTLFEDPQGTLWVGTDRGLKRFDPESGRFTHFGPAAPAGRQGGDTVVRALVRDPGGDFWIGMYGGGLVRLNPADGTWKRIRHDPSNPSAGISSDFVRCLHLDDRGILWVGTDLGLNRYDPARAEWKLYTTRDGLPSDVVYAILPDAFGRFWLSTNHGLSCFEPARASFWNFDRRDGLQSNEFNQGAYCRGRDGELFFGGLNGVTHFRPETIRPNAFVPPVYLTDVRVFDRSLGEGAPDRPATQPPFLREVRLRHDENVLTFEFVALNFQNPERNAYVYTLEGVDQGYIRAGARRYATYGNLAPGTYVFRVRAANNDGVWNNRGANLTIVVVPPWWRTWWAVTLYWAVGAGLVFTLVLLRVRARLRKIERRMLQESVARLREIDALKTEFLNIASHELRTPLTSVVGFARMIQKKLDEVVFPLIPPSETRAGKVSEQIRANVAIIVAESERLTALINDLLDIAKLEAGKVEWKRGPVDVANVVRQGMAAIRPLADPRGLTLVEEIEPGLPAVPGDRDRLLQVVLNLLSNAVKFTDAGEVACGVRRCGDALFVSVRDTGIGIPDDALAYIFEKFRQVGDSLTDRPRGTGLGLSICRQIVEHHGGHIWAEKGPGSGSVFTFTLPVGTA